MTIRPLLRKRAVPDGPTVLFVHGTMDRGAGFQLVARHLPNWTVASYDRRGWGDSRILGEPEAHLDSHVADLLDILSTLSSTGSSGPTMADPVVDGPVVDGPVVDGPVVDGPVVDGPVVDGPVVVAGHSFGGLIALCAAARRPDVIRAVVAFEPPVPWLPWWPDVAPWERVVTEAAAHGPAAAAEAMHRAVVGRSPLGQGGGRDDGRLAADGAALLVEMTDPAISTPSFDPCALTVPVILAAGGKSLPHHRETSRRLAHLIPDGRYEEIAGASHIAHITHADRFADLVEGALAVSAPA